MRGQREVRHWVAVCQQSTQAVEGSEDSSCLGGCLPCGTRMLTARKALCSVSHKCPMSEADRLLLMRG